jgi:hypothetical protein
VRENFKFRPFNKARWGKRVTAPLKGGYIVEIQGVRYASIISRWQDAILDKSRKFQGRDDLLKKEKSDTWSILFDYFALHTMHWIESFVSSTTLVRN